MFLPVKGTALNSLELLVLFMHLVQFAVVKNI